jgi:hypothetical protein
MMISVFSDKVEQRVNKEAQMFGKTFLVMFDRRIGPYIGVYEAFELIDPWCPQSTKDSIKCVAALKKLCLQWNLPFEKVWRQLKLISTTICEEAVTGERERCKADLLPFLNAHVELQPEFWKDKVEAMKFIARSMATPLTSHFVEQLFSLMGFGTGGRRVNTKDDTMANYLHVQSAMKLSSDAKDVADGAGKYLHGKRG